MFTNPKKKATFDPCFDFQQADEETLEVLMEVSSDDNIFEEITPTEHDVLTASTSTTNAIQDMNQALAEDHNEKFQPPRSENKKRFKTVSEEELRELQERNNPYQQRRTLNGVSDYFKRENNPYQQRRTLNEVLRLFQGDLSYNKSIPLFSTHHKLKQTEIRI